jgi:putative ABC transport system permease protein
MAAAIFLLLIAANAANLLLVRASLRERELAVRSALGGNRRRRLTPLLSEAGLVAAFGLTRLMKAMLAADPAKTLRDE